jgi:uncharacterized lipoprotein YmbA
MKTENFLRCSLLVVFLLSSGCTFFQTTPDRTRLFDIGFRGTQAAISSINSAKISLVLSRFPDHLNGPQIITKIGEHELKGNPRYRWARPLSEMVLHIIRQNIRNNFSKVYVYEFPKDSARKVDFTLCLDIDGIEICETTQRVTLKGSWTFLDAKQENIAHAAFEFYESFADISDRYEGIVAGVEQVIHYLSDAIIKGMDLVLLRKETEDNPL